LKVFIHETNII